MSNWGIPISILLIMNLFVITLMIVINKIKRRRQQRLQALFQTSFDGILLVSEDKRILAANPSLLSMSGFSLEELIGHNFCYVTGCDKRIEKEACLGQCLVLNTIREGESLPYLETRMSQKDGSLVPVAITVSSFKGKKGDHEAAIIIRNLGVEKGLTKKLARKLKQIKNAQQRSEALLQLGLELSSVADFNQRLQSVVDQIRHVMHVDFVGLLLMEPKEKYWYWKTLSGNDMRSKLESRIISLEESLLGEIIENGQPIGVKDPVEAARNFSVLFTDLDIQVKGFLGVPVQVRGQVTGVLCAANRQNRSFSFGEVQMLSILANQVAVSVENEALWQQIENQAALRERHWLADEIHDGLAQTVARLQSNIKDIAYLLKEGEKREAEDKLGQLNNLADTAYQEVRQAIFSLKGETDHVGDFGVALEENISEFCLQHHIEVQLISPDLRLFRLPPNIETQLMRIIQEALTNVGKHANASEVKIEVGSWGKRFLRITVADNGKGFELTELKSGSRRRYGLRIMEERILSVGGKFFIESAPSRGTVVTIQVPCQKEILEMVRRCSDDKRSFSG
ncbi:MAG: ATP-binding protein [Desulfitobacterium sp.]